MLDREWPQLEWSISAPGRLSSSNRLAWACVLSSCSRLYQRTWNHARRLVANYHFCCILLAKESPKVNQDSNEGKQILPLDGRSFKSTWHGPQWQAGVNGELWTFLQYTTISFTSSISLTCPFKYKFNSHVNTWPLSLFFYILSFNHHIYSYNSAITFSWMIYKPLYPTLTMFVSSRLEFSTGYWKCTWFPTCASNATSSKLNSIFSHNLFLF